MDKHMVHIRQGAASSYLWLLHWRMLLYAVVSQRWAASHSGVSLLNIFTAWLSPHVIERTPLSAQSGVSTSDVKPISSMWAAEFSLSPPSLVPVKVPTYTLDRRVFGHSVKCSLTVSDRNLPPRETCWRWFVTAWEAPVHTMAPLNFISLTLWSLLLMRTERRQNKSNKTR